MSEEKTALAHIDFLIDPLIRESLGITSRGLGTQVLRLCGGFNDLEEQIKHKDELIFSYDATRTPIIDKTIIDLRAALKAWMKVESEMSDNHPCPDYTLRALYRKEAIKLTAQALEK